MRVIVKLTRLRIVAHGVYLQSTIKNGELLSAVFYRDCQIIFGISLPGSRPREMTSSISSALQ
jgi:hypothetical protein